MPATLDTLDSVLKEFYLGPIQDQLNNEVLALELMEKASVDWSGKRVIIPVHTSRNSGVGYRAEGGTLPTAGSQGFAQLQVQAEFMYGRFEVSGPAIAAAKTGGKNSFISYVDAEMTKLVSDIRNEANQTTFSGGRVIGYLNEKKDKGNGALWEFSGDIAKLKELVDEALAVDKLALCVLNGRDLQPCDPGDAADSIADCIAVNTTTGLITLNTLDTTGVPNGVACPVLLRAADQPAVVLAAATVNSALAGVFGLAGAGGTNEPQGIFSNLSDPVIFGNGTDGALAAPNTVRDGSGELIGNVHSGDDGGDDNRAALSLGELQRLVDQIDVESGEAPDIFLVHPVFRQAYAGLMVATSNNNNNLVVDTTSAGKGDAGFSAFSFNNIPFRSSRHAPKGMVVALHTPSWKLCELESGGFADLDGAVLSRTANADKWEGFYRWYYNQVCLRPGANGILVGFDFPGAGDGD